MKVIFVGLLIHLILDPLVRPTPCLVDSNSFSVAFLYFSASSLLLLHQLWSHWILLVFRK